MPRNYLVGSKVAEFRPADGGDPIPLHGYMQTVNDRIAPRLAMHEFLKVDGGEVEYMGRSPNEYRFTLAIVDRDAVVGETAGEWRAIYNNLAARIERTPKGTLIHPAFGSIRVACRGIDGGAIDVNRAINMVTVPISFVDDSVDTKRDPTGTPSVTVQVSAITDAIDTLNAAAAPFTAAAAQVAILAASAATFAESLQTANDDATEDPSLATQLGTVADDSEATIVAIEADPANDAPTVAFDAVAACELVAATSTDAYHTLRNSRPALTTYVVAADTNIIALAATLYGADATARLDEIAALNPGLPYLLGAGTVLRLSSPPSV